MQWPKRRSLALKCRRKCPDKIVTRSVRALFGPGARASARLLELERAYYGDLENTYYIISSKYTQSHSGSQKRIANTQWVRLDVGDPIRPAFVSTL